MFLREPIDPEEAQEPRSPASGPSASAPDWAREAIVRGDWEPGKRLLRAIRSHRYWRDRGGLLGRVLRRKCVLQHRFWSAVCGADVPLNCDLGGGLMIPHPCGVVIHPGAVLGPNCLVFQGVTIGTGGRIPGVPKLGGAVDVGAGAKLLGGIVVGDRARIGANAVVLIDVPAGRTAVGVPARLVPGEARAS